MKQILLVSCLLASFFSCKNEKKITEAYLMGKWVIIEASRNNKKTNTLDGAFFFFDQKVLTTNFQGIENQAAYTIKDNELKLTKGLDYTFHLQKTEEQFLIMSTKIQNAAFLFKLKKE